MEHCSKNDGTVLFDDSSHGFEFCENSVETNPEIASSSQFEKQSLDMKKRKMQMPEIKIFEIACFKHYL